MGYCTKFELSWTSKGEMVYETEKAIAEYIRNHGEMKYAISEDGDTVQETKWYSWREDMTTMSESFPGVLFKLDGLGEENGDVWTVYFEDGKSWS